MIDRLLCFIIPYFGKLPNYFPVWLQTCRYNPNYNWMIWTDDRRSFDYPENVLVRYCSFDEMKLKVQAAFDYTVALPEPMKMCDFKPAYGLIFEKELREYRFWGYCDLDMFYGNLEHFIQAEKLEKYDKVFSLGHMTIFRNNSINRRLFEKEWHNSSARIKNASDILKSEKRFAFDEWVPGSVTINKLAQQENIRCCYEWPMADVTPFNSSFDEIRYDERTDSWHYYAKNAVFVWKSHKLLECTLSTGSDIHTEELLYVHIQKRKMKVRVNPNENFIIFPNQIVYGEIDDSIIKKYIKLSEIRGIMHIDEKIHRLQEMIGIWKHRFKKYILRKK